MTPRILIAPRPKNWGGPGIFLSRIAFELDRRGYRWTAVPFHYTGISILRWDHAFIMNCPRFARKILNSGKPVITTMGKPESQEEHHAVGRAYLPIYEEQELLMARTIMGSTKVVFISRYVENIWRRIFATRGFPFPMDDRFRVIHHGLDLKHFSPSPRSSRSIFVLGSVGALRERFRLTSLLSVSRILDFEHRLLIVGSMTVECQKVYEEAMRDPEISRRIQYIPWVNAETLPDYYRKMDCLFHPVDYEGLGIVVTEALACGVPVVVPAHGAPKEYVSEDAGIAVETKQFQYDDEFSRNMAEAVYKIRDHQVEYSKGARLQAEKVLSIKNKVDDYLDFMRLPRYIKTGM